MKSRGKKYNNYFSSKIKLGINTERRNTESALTKIKSLKSIKHKHKHSYFQDITHYKSRKHKKDSNASIKSHDSLKSKTGKSSNYGSKNFTFFSRKKAISTKKILSPYAKSRFEGSKNTSPKSGFDYKLLGYKFSKLKKKSLNNTSRYSKDYQKKEKSSMKTERIKKNSKILKKKNKTSLNRIKSMHIKDSRQGFLSSRKNSKFSPKQSRLKFREFEKSEKSENKLSEKKRVNSQIIKKLINFTSVSNKDRSFENEIEDIDNSRKIETEMKNLKSRIQMMMKKNENLVVYLKESKKTPIRGGYYSQKGSKRAK